MNKKLKFVLQTIFVLSIFYFMFLQVYKNWDSLREYDWKFNYFYLISSFIVLVVYYFLIFFGWHIILKKLKVKIKFFQTIKIRAISELGRYMPGKVWHLLGRVYFTKRMGLSTIKIVTSFGLELASSIIAGLMVFLIFFPFFIKTDLTINFLPFLIIGIPLGLICIHPKILNSILNFGLKIIKKQRINIELKYKDMLMLVLMYCSFWLVVGFGFFLLINSIYSIQFSKIFIVVSIYAIGWVIGFLSLITPGGIGVREGVLAGLLALYMPLPIAIIISFVSRIWSIAVELLLAAAFFRVKT